MNLAGLYQRFDGGAARKLHGRLSLDRAGQEVVLPDMVVRKVERGQIIELATERGELLRVGLERLHDLGDGPDIGLHEDTVVRHAENLEGHGVAGEAEVSDGAAEALPHDV